MSTNANTTRKIKSPRVESLMFSKKEDLSTLMTTLLNKSTKNGKSNLDKNGAKTSKLVKSRNFFKKKQFSRAKSAKKGMKSAYLKIGKAVSKTNTQKLKKQLERIKFQNPTSENSEKIKKHQRRSRNPSQNSHDSKQGEQSHIPFSINGQLLDKEPKLTHYGSHSQHNTSRGKFKLNDKQVVSDSTRSQKNMPSSMLKYSIIGQSYMEKSKSKEGHSVNNFISKYMTKSLDPEFTQINISSQRTQRNHYHLKPREETLDSPQDMFNISGEISSIRQLQSQSIGGKMAGLNNLEKRLEQERRKFLAIIQQKDVQIRQLLEELDQAKEKVIKYKLILAGRDKKEKILNEKVEFSSEESDDFENISF